MTVTKQKKMMGLGLVAMGLIVELIVIGFSAQGLNTLFPVGMSILGVSVIIIAAYVIEASKLALAGVLSFNEARNVHMSKASKFSVSALTMLMITVTGAGTWSYFKQTNNIHYQAVDTATLQITTLALSDKNLNNVIESAGKEIVTLNSNITTADSRMDSKIKPFEDKVESLSVKLDAAYTARDVAMSEGAASIDARIKQSRESQAELSKLIENAEKRVLHFIVKLQKKIVGIETKLEKANAELTASQGLGSIVDSAPIIANIKRLNKRLAKAEDKLEVLMEDKDDTIAEATADLKLEAQALSRTIRKLEGSKSNLNQTVATQDARIKRLQAKLTRAEEALEDKRERLDTANVRLVSENNDRILELQSSVRTSRVTISTNAKASAKAIITKETTLAAVGPAKSIADAFGIDGRSAGSLLALFYSIPLVLFGYFMVTFGIKTAYSKQVRRKKPAVKVVSK